MVWPRPRVCPTGFIFCGRTVACFNGRHAPWAVMRAPWGHNHPNIAMPHARGCVFASPLANVYSEGCWRAHCTLLAASCHSRRRKDGGQRSGGDDWREWWWCEDTSPEAFSLALLFLICPPDGSKIKQNMAARRRRGWHQREKTQNNAEGGESGSTRGMTNHPSCFG